MRTPLNLNQHGGKMRRSVLTGANYFAPKRGVLSMHCSANATFATVVHRDDRLAVVAQVLAIVLFR